MRDTNHIHNQISDYVLDLLPDEEKQAAARHVAGCKKCQEAVRREREIGRLVHRTLNKATTPDYGRLQSLMPPIPARRTSVLAFLAPYRQWAIACLLLVAMMGAFIFGGEGGYGLARPADNQQATLYVENVGGTAETITTSEAGTLFSIAAQPTAPVKQSPIYMNAPAQNNPPAAPLPVAPQITPAPAATYFQ